MRNDQIAAVNDKGGRAGDVVHLIFDVKTRFGGERFLAEVLVLHVVADHRIVDFGDVKATVDGEPIRVEDRGTPLGGYRLTRSLPEEPFEGVSAGESIEVDVRLTVDAGQIVGNIYGKVEESA